MMNECEKFLKIALKKADEAELFYSEDSEVMLKSVLDRTESYDSRFSSGYGLRVVKNGRLGFSYFSRPEDFGKALKNALFASKFSEKMDISFPGKQKYPHVDGLCNRDLKLLSDNDLNKMFSGCFDRKFKAHSVQSVASKNLGKSALVNSNGCRVESEDCSMGFSSIMQHGNARSFDFDSSRKIADFERVLKNSAFFAEKFANPKSAAGDFTIILHPHAVMGFFEHIMDYSLNGENAFRKKSFFHDKLGKHVCSEDVSITDNPLISNGIGSCFSDDEGAAAKKRNLVEDGALKNFVYDLKTSFMAKTTPTGNGARGSFASEPGASCHNIEALSTDYAEFGSLSGVLVYDVMGMHNVNPSSGDFALQVINGCFVKNGELEKSVKGTLVGNFFGLLKNVRLADDIQKVAWYYGPSWVYEGKIV